MPKVLYVGSILTLSQGAMPLLLSDNRVTLLAELLVFANMRDAATSDIAGVAVAKFVDGRGVSSRAYSLNGLEVVDNPAKN